jgi:Domain of unknown function (DUF4062)
MTPRKGVVSSLQPVSVMISSPVDDTAGGERLSSIRNRIDERLSQVKVRGASVINVWLNEKQGALGQDETAWQMCMAEARRCDVLVVLYMGKAGWVRDHLGIGICHAEWQTGFTNNPQKVRVVRFKGPTLQALLDDRSSRSKADRAFYDALDGTRWRVDATTADELVDKACEGAWWAITDLVRTGRLAGSRGRNLYGQSLDWVAKDFEEREPAMLEALANALVGDAEEGHVVDGSDGRMVTRSLGGASVGFRTHAVPGPFGLAEARASLGQPFRDERVLLGTLEAAGAIGPIHVVAVQQAVTETQIRRFIGRPDALVAAQSFGVFVSDDSNFTQALFLSNCRDAARVSDAVGNAFAWWKQAGLEVKLARWAAARMAILRALRDATQP